MRDSVDMRYALALFSVAKEDNQVIKYQNEVKQLNLLLTNNKELFELLKSEFLELKVRYEVVDKLFKIYSKPVINFLKILIQNHRINSYQIIFNSFNSLCNEENNVLEGIIYSTEKLAKEKINEIEDALKKKNNVKVELTNRIDPSLIGGIKVVIDNHIYDYSIQNEINSLMSQLKM